MGYKRIYQSQMDLPNPYWHWSPSQSRRNVPLDVGGLLACLGVTALSPSLVCLQVDCLDPMCSGHGTCHHGECHCNPGWGGISCDILKSTCPEQCSSHGTFNTDSGVCICEANWTGADCSIGQNKFLFLIFSWINKLQLYISTWTATHLLF